MKGLSEKALLVNIKINQWSASKLDKNVTRKIEKQHNAHNAGRFTKALIAETNLQEIKKIVSSVRGFLYHHTLPWGDNGDRLLPATNYFEFVTEFGTYKSQFDAATNRFIAQYPALKEEARKRLNDMFQETDYPSLFDVKEKFNIRISSLPISDLTDLRINLGKDEVIAIKQQMESEINSRVNQANKDIWERIKEAVGHIAEKLSDKDAIFRDSLITNIRELIDVLPRLNFTGNQDINNIIENMKSLLVLPDTLRKSSTIRNKKAKEAKAILDKITDFLG